MYYYIKGNLVHKGDNYIVVEAGGIGYMIYSSSASILKAGIDGKEVTVYTYLYVREDIMDIYGFLTLEEKNMFMNLIGVSGVGPKAALAILSVISPTEFAAAVITKDVKTITKAPGVGPKVAQRIILELTDKMKKYDLPETASVSLTDSKNEAVSALMVLGYSGDDAQSAVKGIDGSLDVEEIIKKALANLMK